MRKKHILFLLFSFFSHQIFSGVLDTLSNISINISLLDCFTIGAQILFLVPVAMVLCIGLFLFVDVIELKIPLLLLSFCQNPDTFITLLDKKDRYVCKTSDSNAERLAHKTIEKNNIPLCLALIKRYKLSQQEFLKHSIYSKNLSLN